MFKNHSHDGRRNESDRQRIIDEQYYDILRSFNVCFISALDCEYISCYCYSAINRFSAKWLYIMTTFFVTISLLLYILNTILSFIATFAHQRRPKIRVRVMVFNVTFNNVSVTSWWSVLLVEETGVPRENHLLIASHWQTLLKNNV